MGKLIKYAIVIVLVAIFVFSDVEIIATARHYAVEGLKFVYVEVSKLISNI